MSAERFAWWNNLIHGGLLLDTPRLSALVPQDPELLSVFDQDRLRRRLARFQDDPTEHRGELVSFVLEAICGFTRPLGEWSRGSEVKTAWSRRAITGESIRPRHLWLGKNGASLPVFIDDQSRLGIGRGRRAISHVLSWLRQGKEQLAIVTNGQQWRLLFAGLDYDAFCQWDVDLWFAEGSASQELGGFRALLDPARWTPPKDGEACPLLAAINESRKGQADLSQILGERVRQAAELLIQAHAPALKEHMDELSSQDIYRAAVRMIMRLVVILFAESREGLLARDNPVYHGAYSLQGLREQLERISQHKLASSVAAYPRILSLLRLIHQGSSHPDLPVPAYGGELFAPGRADDADGMKRALHLFESACFNNMELMNDYFVRQILELLTRTKVKIRQGRANMLMPAPVDFSSLDSEYIGILYEGLLDFELRSAVQDEPIVFLAVGNQPALPLTTLEQMNDQAIKNLLEKFAKDAKQKAPEAGDSGDDSEEEGDESEEPEQEEIEDDLPEDESEIETAEDAIEDLDLAPDEQPVTEQTVDDSRYTLQTRAEAWARRACQVGGLVSRPRGRLTPERQLQFERALAAKAKSLIVKVVLPGEWYLVRWGGTRKGSGTFYTRPQLAIPTVHRTLRPLAYDPPNDDQGQPNTSAPAEQWTPKKPEEILSLKVCDPACGSGSFPLAALRFLTGALYESLIVHNRVRDHGGRAMLDLIFDEQGTETLASEPLPCRPEDDDFEPRTKAILRRYVVERCIYGVDLDPLAVELCRLSLWIETLDRSLPLTFLNHKIKCGNSLVGAWFDQFLHYPAMAWDREGGDKNHSNGVHFPKEGWTRAIKAFKARVKPDLIRFIDGGVLSYYVDLTTVRTGHDAAEAALNEIHQLGIAQVDQRAARYEALLASEEFQKLKAAFDLWCSLWFWPADQLEHGPLPTQFAAGEINDDARRITTDLAQRQRFFHWELEFPDVFNSHLHGFDAMLGNPPWDIAKPNSKEFFSAFDPLYRSYGKQEALRKQKVLFQHEELIEREWLEYCAYFKASSNWVKYAGFPFGDRVKVNAEGKKAHDFPIGDRGRTSFSTSQRRHDRWKQKREESSGYADADHSFRHQGSADLNLYKLFLEQAHALLGNGGRLGLIVPSGLYSDYGTGELRRLFVDGCRWEWLFGFENREGIFDIHRSFKFNPIVVAKGGQTETIRTAFMRRNLADWEQGEEFAADYSRQQVSQFSPSSLTLLEVQTDFDLSILNTLYEVGAVMNAEPWSIAFAQPFDMTSDSRLFPPLPVWERKGYVRNDYDIWCNDDEVALPVLEGRMIGQFDYSEKGWVSGKGRSAVWRGIPWAEKRYEPQFLMSGDEFNENCDWFSGMHAIAYMKISSSTNTRTMIATVVQRLPAVYSLCYLIGDHIGLTEWLALAGCLNSFVTDFSIRLRLGGLNLTGFILRDVPVVPRQGKLQLLHLAKAVARLAFPSVRFACEWLLLAKNDERAAPMSWHGQWALTEHERVRVRAMIDALVAAGYEVSLEQFKMLFQDCDYSVQTVADRQFSRLLNPKGFWRVDKHREPEHRLTILSIVAFYDLQEKIADCGGDVAAGIEAFCNQNDGEGWMLPETLRLADYGMGHDERANEHQPVRECFGPRFYDWQLAQTPEESWRECHLHARNLLGPEGYQRLLDELAGNAPAPRPSAPAKAPSKKTNDGDGQGKLFDTEHHPLFDAKEE